MVKTLCDLSRRLLVRRVRSAVASAPGPAAAVLVALLASPLLLYWAASVLQRLLESPTMSVEVSEALAVGLLVSGAAAGVALSLSLPGIEALGEQVAAAPVGRRVAFVALAAVPLGLLLAVAGALVLAFVLPFALAAPGGVGSAVALAMAAIAAGAVAAALADALRLAMHGRLLGAVLAAVIVGAWLVPLWGTRGLGPLTTASRSLAEGHASAGSGAAAVVAVVATGIWLGLRPLRPVHRSNVRWTIGMPIASSVAAAALVAAGALLLRRPDCRAAVWGGIGTAAMGGAVTALAGLPAAVVVPLAAVTASLTAATVPLVAATSATAARVLWHPVGRWVVAASYAVPALGTPVALAGAVTAAGVGVLGQPPRGIAPVVGAAAVPALAGLAAGALVPWRDGRAGDQLVAFAALGACCAIVSAAVVAAARALEEVIAVSLLAAALPLAVVASVATWLLARRAGDLSC